MILGKSETVQITYNAKHQGPFLLVQGTSFTRGETSDRTSYPQKLARTLWTVKTAIWLTLMRSKVGSRRISLKSVWPPSNPVSEQDYCQIGMTAIVMVDVDTLYTRPSVLTADTLLTSRALLNEHSVLIRILSLSFARRRSEKVRINDLIILRILQLSDVHVGSLPIEVQRADALYGFLQMPTNAGTSGSSTLAGEF